MFQHRGVLLRAVISGVAGVLFLVPASSVQAGTDSLAAAAAAPAGLATRLFDRRNLPSQRDLLLLQSGAAAPQDVPLPEGKGKDLTQKKCNMCHASTVWTQKHYTEDQWSAVIDSMLAKGLVASDDEIAVITSYLAANFGPTKKDVPATPPSPQ